MTCGSTRRCWGAGHPENTAAWHTDCLRNSHSRTYSAPLLVRADGFRLSHLMEQCGDLTFWEG